MAIICPAILATDKGEYGKQVEKIVHLAHRIQIDLTDGKFAPSKTVAASEAWWPVGFLADFHLMYEQPLDAVKTILKHQPNLIIVHAEAAGDFDEVALFCRNHNVKIGLALLHKTSPETIEPVLSKIDHVLIFSGVLGSYGGSADLGLLEKVKYIKSKRPEVEVGWDGGINDQDIAELVSGGVDVLNVGGYIQKAEDPAKAFSALQRIADETGET